MRRSTVASVTLLKYLIVAALFLTLGSITTNLFLRDHHDSRHFFVREPLGGHGLPVDPEELEVRHEVIVRQSTPASRLPVVKNQPLDLDLTDPNKKIDWHNYTLIAQDELRTGPGEQGVAVILSAEEELKKVDLFKVNGFNAIASDKISLDRALNDIRHPDCKHQKYLAKLPNVSVVIPFHNEHWSTLLRSVASVLNRSPKHLIHEIILVDDYSSKEHCKKPLDDYLASHFDGKVKVVHQDKREGLIRSRLTGAKLAKGEVLIFLDSHVEANVNWLPPLLEPIAQDYQTVVCPFIDVIEFETFAYRAQDDGRRGAFDWELYYKRLPLLPEDLKNPSKPFKSPVMAGGLFAISSKWFWELGGYDPGLDIWGGEQYELSFKLWQCGGMMVDAPCSRVGHIYRKSPFPNPGVGDFIGRNFRRVAEVWMDEYKEYLYNRRPHYRSIDPGDISQQLAIRTKLNCKPFSWFMKEVAFDLPKKYPPVEPPLTAEGELRNVAADLCIDTKYHNSNELFGLEPCTKDNPSLGGEQHMVLSWHPDLRLHNRPMCFDVSESIPKAPIMLYGCHGLQGNQLWKYNVDTSQLFHPGSGQCLDCDPTQKEIFMQQCDEKVLTQRWVWGHVNVTQARLQWQAPVD